MLACLLPPWAGQLHTERLAFLAEVSNRHDGIRGEGERQSSGLPV